jgi:hypothetical protein
MEKKITRSRPWTKEEVRMRKTLAREKTKTTVIARKLKRSVAAVYLHASKLAVILGEVDPVGDPAELGVERCMRGASGPRVITTEAISGVRSGACPRVA